MPLAESCPFSGIRRTPTDGIPGARRPGRGAEGGQPLFYAARRP